MNKKKCSCFFFKLEENPQGFKRKTTVVTYHFDQMISFMSSMFNHARYSIFTLTFACFSIAAAVEIGGPEKVAFVKELDEEEDEEE